MRLSRKLTSRKFFLACAVFFYALSQGEVTTAAASAGVYVLAEAYVDKGRRL